jgi:hypothetical protein
MKQRNTPIKEKSIRKLILANLRYPLGFAASRDLLQAEICCKLGFAASQSLLQVAKMGKFDF